MIERICSCGKTFRVIPSRLKHGRGKHCSSACQYKSAKLAPKKVVERICIGCGTSFFIGVSSLKNKIGAGKYCNRKCRDENRTGNLSPNFIDGESGNWHGSNWYAQRRKAKTRDDYVCIECGISEQESLDLFGQVLHVHHIVPFRKFEGDYKKANVIENLETLCPACHRTKDGKIQREERRTHDQMENI